MSYTRTSKTTRSFTSGGSGGGGGSRTVTTTTTYGGGGTHTTNTSYGDGNIKLSTYAKDEGFRFGTKYRPSPRSTGFRKELFKVERGYNPSQKYEEIKKQCLDEGRLWEDPLFPADDRSIFFSKSPPRPFEWKRPSEITSDPKFFVGGASRFDVRQGELGDCWLLAAVASLSLHKQLLARVVPHDQCFDGDYCGIFHFQFWQFGEWIDIVIDDRLPTYYGRLVFMQSESRNEFWTPLLEKAYAKLCGSYESLKGGSTSEAMEDFTGGVTEMFNFTDKKNLPPNMLQIMLKAVKRSSLMACSIEASKDVVEEKIDNGLIKGHAYSVTGCLLANIETPRMKGQFPLVRVRNPWGDKHEWNGAWSDGSPEWKVVSDEERERIGLTFEEDGEFWMSFKDFSTCFQRLEICNLGPDSIEEETDFKNKKRWESCIEGGSWKHRVTAGGCRNFLDTFAMNPQFMVEVTDPDDDDEDDKGTLIVGLMQKGRRKLKCEGIEMVTIGYAIYKARSSESGGRRKMLGNDEKLDKEYFQYNASVARSPSFINLREVCGRHKLPAGKYVIVPSTYEADQEGDFLLRIFSEKKNNSCEMDEKTGMVAVEEPQNIVKDDAQTKALRQAFEQISGEDLEIDAYELRDILNAAFRKAVQSGEFKFDGFGVETCRSMVALMDVDRSGKLGFDEFNKLWNDLRLWKTAFKKYDVDNSGTFSSSELRACFHHVGIRLSNDTFRAIVLRYCQKDGTIDFDDFIAVSVRLKTVFETFQAMDDDRSGEIKFDLDEFIGTTLYT